MIKLMIKKYNLILGILIGLILAQFIINEGYGIISLNGEISSTQQLILKIIAVSGFILTIVILNTNISKKINFDKISIYLILVVLISLVVGIESIFIIATFIVRIVPDIPEYFRNNYLFALNAMYIFIFIGISLFLMTFILLVNRKVKYIKFLTEQVKLIEKEGFGRTIKVKGNDELADLCRSINTMSVELGYKISQERKIEESKHELITNMSHDLKTPLTSIVGYLELLNTKELDNETRENYTKIAYSKSLRLKSLVNELFEYTKLSGNDIKFDKNKVNISVLLNQAVGESIINFSDKNIEVILNNPYKESFCNVDSVQMLRVFENLIKNAEKYADPDSKFIVSLEQNDHNIYISFINKCESIEEQDVEKLFERFYRKDKSRSKEGTGLGLAIAERIIKIHEGSIEAQKNGDNIEFNIILKKY